MHDAVGRRPAAAVALRRDASTRSASGATASIVAMIAKLVERVAQRTQVPARVVHAEAAVAERRARGR